MRVPNIRREARSKVSTQKNQRRRSQQKLLRPRPPQDPISTTTGSSESSTTATTPLAPTLSPLQTNFWSTPVGTATAVADDDMAEAESTAYPDGLAFCQIMFSSHHEHNKEQPLGSIDTLESSDLTIGVTLEAVCQSLRIPESIYHTLMASYFQNMTAFSLFKPGSVEAKFSQMHSIAEAEALVASIFSFSARFHAGEKDESLWNYFPAPSYFAKIASKRIEDALGPYDETPPPLWLLQASVLDTFYRLTRSVRSSSWRATGNLVRLGYDLGLHLVDVDGQRRDSQGNIDVEFWSAQEEQRRCWWAIWELDVYASTIRRLPLGMHWSQMYTLLPIHDSDWFENRYRPSCRLPKDAATRWETLLASGNTSPRAWFIAVSSLMHDAQQLAYTPETNQDLTGSQKAQQLAGISNCLSHTTTALPAGLRYLGEPLDFRTKAAPSEASLRQHHADIFSIHMVTQLTRFMLTHQHVHAVSQTSPGVHGSPASHSQGEQATADDAAWTDYVEASEAIVALVRNSPHDSYKYLNPLVAHAALWFAATAQSTYLGRSRYSKTLAASNYELLARFIEQCVGFWGSAEILRPHLGKSEATALDNLMHTPEQQRDGNHGAGRAGGGDDAEMETPPMMNSDSTGHGAPGYVDLVGMQVGGDGGLDGPQQAGTLSFLPMLQERPLMSQLGSFEDLEYLFPYGVDNAGGQGTDNPPAAV